MTDKLLQHIQSAFSQLRRPAQIGYGGAESHDVECFFAQLEPLELSENMLINSRYGDWTSYLSFMSNEGFLYFLPGYMRMIITSEPDNLGSVIESLFWCLAPIEIASPDSAAIHHLSQYHNRKHDALIQQLTKPQASAISAFFEHQTNHYGNKPILNGKYNDIAKKLSLFYGQLSKT